MDDKPEKQTEKRFDLMSAPLETYIMLPVLSYAFFYVTFNIPLISILFGVISILLLSSFVVCDTIGDRDLLAFICRIMLILLIFAPMLIIWGFTFARYGPVIPRH